MGTYESVNFRKQELLRECSVLLRKRREVFIRLRDRAVRVLFNVISIGRACTVAIEADLFRRSFPSGKQLESLRVERSSSNVPEEQVNATGHWLVGKDRQ